MSPLDSTLQNLNDCGCCAGISPETPVKIDNRPGLSAIAYRIGTQPQFRETLLARLSAKEFPALRALTTRDNTDFSIAFLDAVATVADVLAFYQERIANENYLRTATDRYSVLQLARLIGYELRPGVAASAFLAFTLEEAPGAFGQGLGITPAVLAGVAAPPPAPVITIDIGTKVQSVPGPGEQAQTFETVEAIEAHPSWSAIRPRSTWPQSLSVNSAFLILQGTANNLKRGDMILIRDGSNSAVKRIVTVTTDDDAGTTRVDFTSTPPALPPYQRPNGLQQGSATDFAPGTPLDETAVRTILSKRWDQPILTAIADTEKWPHDQLEANINEQAARQTLPPGAGVFVFRQKAAVFGHNAPLYDSLPAVLRKGEKYTGGSPSPIVIDPAFPNDWEGKTLEDDSSSKGPQRSIFLDNTYPGIVTGSWIALLQPSGGIAIYSVNDNQETSRSDYTLNAKISKLSVNAPNPFDAGFTIRNTTVLAQSEPLTLAPLPIGDQVATDPLTLDGAYLGLKPGKNVILTGERGDLKGVTVSEKRAIGQAILENGYTVLVFDTPLTYTYLRDTVAINANVALATHGESVQELLGGGDSSQPFQKFTLKQPRLTYIPAATDTGAASTLQVRVNELLWKEVPTLYGHGSEERIYITRQEDGGNTNVIFGDGATGSRPPTGVDNIRANYRRGIGLAGLVKADQLTQLANRPLGLKGVTNPLPATGAEDPENLDQARRNAPLQVLTLGRIASLQDYEDFARAFAGIGKALATWTWNGEVRGVFLTLAGANGAAVESSDPLYTNLVNAIAAAGDPTVPVTIQSYTPRLFRISAGVKVDPAYIKKDVLANVEKVLRDAFSFDARDFGQPVALSEVVEVMQKVDGVVAVNVTALARTDGPVGPLLGADAPRPGTANAAPAELLTLDPAPLDLGVLS
jgi:hypothetical protein